MVSRTLPLNENQFDHDLSMAWEMNKTRSTSSSSQKLSMEMKRQHSYTTLARLIGGGDNKAQSPGTPSPEGTVQMKKVVQRLEEIDTESRHLLQTLFSMLGKDARLERYIRLRLDDPKVSQMWELVERILSAKHDHIDLGAILTNNEEEAASDAVAVAVDKGLKGSETSTIMEASHHEMEEMPMGRFKIRTLDTADVHGFPAGNTTSRN